MAISRVLRGGVIGFGDTGQKMTKLFNGKGGAVPEYITRMRGQAQIVAACNRSEAKLEIAREQFGLKTTHDAAELCGWKDIDFVLVTSTSHVHMEQVEAAAKEGKHVFCEKPIALNLEDAAAMIEAVEKAGVVNVVNYSIRYIDAYRQIKQMHEAGRFGEILSIWTTRSRGWGLDGVLRETGGQRHSAVIRPEESGGWTVHHACHDLDFLYWVNGRIAKVYGQTASTFTGKESEEVVIANVTFENGSMGYIGDSVCQMRDHYTGVIGTRGQIALSGEHDHTRLRFWPEGQGMEPEIIQADDTKRVGGGLDHFIECIVSRESSSNSIRSGFHSLACALAVQESARSGQPVNVPPEPRSFIG